MSRFPYRQIVELKSVGLSDKKVSFLCGCGVNKVRDVLAAARQIGVGWPVPAELSDDDLELMLDPLQPWRRHQPDFKAIGSEAGKGLRAGDFPEVYGIYRDMAAAAGEEPYAESTLRQLYAAWLGGSKPPLHMRVDWSPAEEIQVDWAGKKIQLYGEDGLVAPAFLFVATSPYSSYTFIRASLDMGMQSWLEHHVAMFSFFGGAPLWLAPDNLAQAVTFGRQGHAGRTVNRKYQDLADHYGAMVLPARVGTPTDKAAVEGHVRIMANRIIGVLEGMRFSTIDQLNDAVARLLAAYNAKPTHALGGRSRLEVFLVEEKPCLQPLPEALFSPVTWKGCSVARDGVVTVRGNHYGVPEAYAGRQVEVRIGAGEVAVYAKGRRQCLARHPRGMDGADTFAGLPGTCPDRFRPLDDWCRAEGREQILRQWDAEANGGLTPADVVCRSKREVHWKCPECGFTWSEAPARRTGRGFDDCLACADVALVPGKNDLATLFPDVAAEWHSERNPMPASSVFPDYRLSVWWRGECGHEWKAPIAERVRSVMGRACPYCSGKKALAGFNDVASVCPEMAAHWHPVKNRNVRPEGLSVMAAHEVYLWDGALSRIWRETPRSWMARNGYGDRLGPFERAVAEAKAIDEAAEGGESTSPAEAIGRGKSTVKWARYNRESGLLGMTLEGWCKAFGRGDLLDEWDRERNGDLAPADVLRASTWKVWWRGGCGHSWQAEVRSRVFDDHGCPYCGRARVLDGYSSAAGADPRLLALWHPTRNGGLTPSDVSDRSHKMIWWQCPKCGYEWRESLRKTGKAARTCPACEGRRGYAVPGGNTLSGRPDLASLFAVDLNGGLAPDDVRAHARRKVWWRGECGHVWEQRVDQMADLKGEKCPFCANRRLLRGFNDLATLEPEVALSWDAERNGRGAGSVRANSSEAAWWRGACGHGWDAPVSAAVAAGGACPICAGRRVLAGFNDLASVDPGLAAQWHPSLNGGLSPRDVTAGSSRKAWWLCDGGHEWQATINNRHRLGSACPVCANRLAVAGANDLATTHGKLARQWDRGLNGGLTPRDVTARSTKKAWWLCKEGHSFQMQVVRRAGGRDPGCPYCAGRRVLPGFNDLATVRPDIASQWHPTMNRRLGPSEVLATSGKEAWWKGECGHTWKAKVRDRTRAKSPSCPYCSGRRKPERPIKLD